MIQTVVCPSCSKKVNVASHLQSVKCGKCGKVFPIQETDEEEAAPKDDVAARYAGPMEESGKSSGGAGKWIGAVVGLVLFLGIVGAVGYYLWTREPAEQVASGPPEPDVEWTPPEYVEIDMSEPDRKRIYMQMREAAVKTIEKPIPLPEGLRESLERTLQMEWEREIAKQAALHDVDKEDIQQIVNEGDAKRWDPSPRSNAKRGGKRIYPKSWSEGWTK